MVLQLCRRLLKGPSGKSIYCYILLYIRLVSYPIYLSTSSAIGWRLGLQAVTVVVFITFILGTFYRSASLYHPQRRAILHLKNQKRKIKDKNKANDGPPFFDFSTLRSKTVRILLISTGDSHFLTKRIK